MRTQRPVRLSSVIGTVAIVLAAVVAVVVVQRYRATRKAQVPQGGTSMANMPGMSMTANGAVSVTPTQMRELGVTFASVEMRPLIADTRATGVVAFDETRVAQVAPKIGGFVERLYVNATGQPVSRGQPLLDVYSADVVAAENELLLAERLQRNIGQSSVPGVPASSTDLVRAARKRLELWDVSAPQIDEVMRTGQARRTVTLYAPTSGVVVTKNVVEGQAISAGQSLYTIVSMSDVWIDVQLREADASLARVGAAADIEVTGVPGQLFKGRVAYVYPTLDTASRAVRARIVVSNSTNALRPGMYATVHLLTTAGHPALTVPSSAVLRTGERSVVFVDLGGGRLMPTEIETGRTAVDFVEVLAGLEPGQRVAMDAQFLIDSESNLGEVMRSMISQLPSPGR